MAFGDYVRYKASTVSQQRTEQTPRKIDDGFRTKFTVALQIVTAIPPMHLEIMKQAARYWLKKKN